MPSATSILFSRDERPSRRHLGKETWRITGRGGAPLEVGLDPELADVRYIMLKRDRP